MFNSKLLLSLILMFCLFSSGQISAQLKIPFSFNLQDAASTSAGVYTKDGTLVKTLWNGVQYSAGAQTATWDGTGDDDRLLANADYDIRVLSNNVKYTWDGVIGNTSESFTGPNVYRGYLRLYSMAVAGNTAYISNYYNEGHSSQFKFSLDKPQFKTEILSSGQSTMFVATDGVNVYWAGDDVLGGHLKWFVFSTRTSDDGEVIFPGGQSVPVQYGRTYASGIDISYNINENITGLAVQKTGNFLFVARQNLNQIHVLNKTTGALVRVITAVTGPNRMAVDGNDNLWIVSAGGINKYAINADGSLGGAIMTLSAGFYEPWAIAVSPDNNTVVIADGGSSQQLKAFNNNTGSALWIYGQSGGYANDPAVTDNKFYFSDQRHGNDGSFIAFQPDGSFWVEDPGNFRAQHFSANRTFIDRIMYLPAFYGGSADPNNPSRVFSDQLEFSVDYSKPLAPNNGSWTLVRNWESFIHPDYTDRLRSVTTLSNGRTYAFLIHNYKYALVELTSAGLRYTGFETPDFKFDMQKNGSLLSWGDVPLGSPFGVGSLPLTGFDGSNNPIWGGSVTIATTQPVTAGDPVFHGSGNVVQTSSDVLVSFDAGLPPYSSTNYHLGGVKSGTNVWSWKTAKSTFKEYRGPFPNDGAYDIGNEVQYAGSMAVALDRSIIWGYHGEFWKGGEINYFTHVYDDGLMVSQFGSFGGANAPPGLAGNVFTLSMVKDGNGNAYLYHNDESVHAGLHRWKISGLETIREQTIPVTLSPAIGGLLCQYFDGDDLNNFNVKTAVVNSTVNNNPVPAVIPNPNNSSSRWSGYITPVFNDSYTFYANLNKSVRLWVDGNLIINKWDNAAQNEFSGAITLEAGKKYPVVIEMKGSTASLSWSSPNQSKQIIPSGNLTPSAVIADSASGVDLLEGLPFKNILENNLYGWQRESKYQDTSGLVYVNWWSVKTSEQAYKKPDVSIRFTQSNKNVVYTVARDLGNQSGSWKLSGHISHEGDALSPLGYDGVTLSLLNVSGISILDFKATIDYGTAPDYIETLTANGVTVAQAPAATFYEVWRNVQQIIFEKEAGQISILYANYSKVYVTPLAAGVPKTMALYFRSNGSNGTRMADIVDMRFFSASTQTTLPLDLLSFKATPVSNHVNVLWATENEVNTRSFSVERSSDGQVFRTIGSVDAKNISGKQDYSFTDANPLEGISYYRLKMIDKDDQYKYSKVVTVNRQVKDTRFEVYPNPVQDLLKVSHPAVTEKGSLEIISADGRSIKTVLLQKGNTSNVVDIRSLYSGFYLLQYRDGDSKVTTPFLKQ